MGEGAGVMIERLDHVAVVVTDVGRAVAFYRDVLGMREVPRPDTFDFPGAWLEAGPAVVHLLGKAEAGARTPAHFCLWVRDVHAAARSVGARGCAVQWHTNHKIPGVDRFFTYDPDGNRVELQGPESRL